MREKELKSKGPSPDQGNLQKDPKILQKVSKRATKGLFYK